MATLVPDNQAQNRDPQLAHGIAALKRKVAAGITAGVEDAKYSAKYHELRRKVKDIELVSTIFFRATFSLQTKTFIVCIGK
jgi:hypothetical protein